MTEIATEIPTMFLSFRAQCALANILDSRPGRSITLEKLKTLSASDVLMIPNCGRKTLTEIAEWMKRHGVEFADGSSAHKWLTPGKGTVRERDRDAAAVVRVLSTLTPKQSATFTLSSKLDVAKLVAEQSDLYGGNFKVRCKNDEVTITCQA